MTSHTNYLKNNIYLPTKVLQKQYDKAGISHFYDYHAIKVNPLNRICL